MASFCKQCSIELFGEDFRDLANIGALEPGMGWCVLCEDCGWTIVDSDGKCIAERCSKHGPKRHDRDI